MSVTEKASPTKGGTPEVRAKAFARWDTNKDCFLTLDEYKARLKGQREIQLHETSLISDIQHDGRDPRRIERQRFVRRSGIVIRLRANR